MYAIQSGFRNTKNKLQTIQNKASRLITGFTVATDKLPLEMRWENIAPAYWMKVQGLSDKHALVNTVKTTDIPYKKKDAGTPNTITSQTRSTIYTNIMYISIHRPHIDF